MRSDNGGEFNSGEFNEHCVRHGILRELTPPYSSSQNGVVERMSRTLQDITRALIKQADLPMSYWGEAVSMAAYLHNRLPRKAVDTTPYELLYRRKPSTEHIRIFGMPAYAHQNSEQVKHSKLSDRFKKYIFVGFTDGIKAYKLYDPITRQIVYSRSVIFDEHLQSQPTTSVRLEEVRESADDTQSDMKNRLQVLLLATHKLHDCSRATPHM